MTDPIRDISTEDIEKLLGSLPPDVLGCHPWRPTYSSNLDDPPKTLDDRSPRYQLVRGIELYWDRLKGLCVRVMHWN